MASARKEKRSPLFHMRMPEELYDWLRDYSRRTGQPMAAIIKDHLRTLKRKDEGARRKAAKEG